MFGQGNRGDLGQLHHPAFRSAISRDRRNRQLSVDRGHIDDRAFDAIGNHGFRRALRGQEHGIEIDRDDPVEAFQVVVQEIARHRDTRIVDQCADRANISLDLVEHRGNCLRVGHVTDQTHRAIAQRFSRLGNALCLDIGQNQAIAVLGQCLRAGKADALSAPCDQCNWVFCHVNSPNGPSAGFARSDWR